MREEDIDALADPNRLERVLFSHVTERAEPRRQRVTGARRRVEILEAVIPVFAARGCARATVRRLEEAAPVSRPTMYGYFPSKAQLYTAALRHEAARVEAVLLPALAGAYAQDLALPAVLDAGRTAQILADATPLDGAPRRLESGLEPLARVVFALVRWARRNPDSARLLLQRPIEEDAVVAVHAQVRGVAIAKVAEHLNRDRTLRAQRGLTRRRAVQLHAEMLVGAAEAVLHWALANPVVPAQHLVRTWNRPPREDLRRTPGPQPSPVAPITSRTGRGPPRS